MKAVTCMLVPSPKVSAPSPKVFCQSPKCLVRAQRFPIRAQKLFCPVPKVPCPSPKVSGSRPKVPGPAPNSPQSEPERFPSETKGSRLCPQPHPARFSNVSYPSPRVPSRPAEAAPSKPTDQSGQAQVGHTQAKPDRPAHEPKLEDEPEHGPSRAQTKHPSDEKVLGVAESSYVFYSGPIRGLLAPVWFAIGPKEYL